MGLKPVPFSYPAEWLLDIFTGPGRRYRPRPYVMSIELPKNYATWYANGVLACVVTLVLLVVYRFL